MAKKWSIKTYNDAIRAIRQAHPKADIARARAIYRNLRDQLVKPVSSVDVHKNTKLVEKAHKATRAKVKVRPDAGGTRKAGATKRINSLDEWLDIYDDYDTGLEMDIEAGVNY